MPFKAVRDELRRDLSFPCPMCPRETGGSLPESVRWDGGGINEDGRYAWVCANNDGHVFYWAEDQTAEGMYPYGLLTLAETLAALDARGLDTTDLWTNGERSVPAAFEAMIPPGDEQREVLLASVRKHESALFDLVGNSHEQVPVAVGVGS